MKYPTHHAMALPAVAAEVASSSFNGESGMEGVKALKSTLSVHHQG
ncbi:MULTISPECIES: hypothetical protein [unclassified Erwinia]|nr:hypothetical protein [Erwinia sp. ErVv1]